VNRSADLAAAAQRPSAPGGGRLRVTLGQHSHQGRKPSNQDFHGAWIPTEPQLSSKGVAIALADGISSSDVSHIASEVAVTGFLQDYYSTSEAWSVQKSAQRVLAATNSWLHAQTQRGQGRHDKDRGYVCTFSALLIKSATAHLFHVGDARVYRLRGESLEQLTSDHRLWVSRDTSYLSRALGIAAHVEIDYRALPVEQGDVFFLATDGVHEYVDAAFVARAVHAHDDLDAAARAIVEEAYARGSDDNLTAQIVRIDALPTPDADEFQRRLSELPPPPPLEPRMSVDGYRIVRVLRAGSRSHVFLAVDEASNTPVVLKTLSTELRQDPAQVERFLTEEWIARRIDSAHVLKPCPHTRERSCLYIATEYIDGQTLRQWMIDNPKPDLETVRAIVEQIARGLRAFHRLEMLHQDLRPENVMIDRTGTVKIIDFGSTQVAGLLEIDTPLARGDLLGTAQYAAPEYFLGESGSTRSDIYSLGVITYEMLTGRLPYGAEVAKTRTRAQQNRLKYRPAASAGRPLPAWIDAVLHKTVHPDPRHRYEALSEFIHDLRHPNDELLRRTRPPPMERDPVLFWKVVSLLLALMVVALLVVR